MNSLLQQLMDSRDDTNIRLALWLVRWNIKALQKVGRGWNIGVYPGVVYVYYIGEDHHRWIDIPKPTLL